MDYVSCKFDLMDETFSMVSKNLIWQVNNFSIFCVDYFSQEGYLQIFRLDYISWIRAGSKRRCQVGRFQVPGASCMCHDSGVRCQGSGNQGTCAQIQGSGPTSKRQKLFTFKIFYFLTEIKNLFYIGNYKLMNTFFSTLKISFQCFLYIS